MGTMELLTTEALILHDPMVAEGAVREIAADSGTWDHTIKFDVSEIQKALAAEGKSPDDSKPMFVEVLVLHKGHSKKTDGTKNVFYSDQAVKDTARLLPGSLAYLGHQEPGKEEFEYRTPVAKYVSARVEEREVKEVGKVPCVIGKAYISSAAAARDLRTHIREGMAGPVSISGTALFSANRGVRTNETVGMARLRSVDFCNPGTPGIAGAGVVGVVREISNGTPAGSKSTMADRLNRKQLQVEYADEIGLIVADETAALTKTLGEVRETAKAAEAKVASLTTEKTTLAAKVEEMTKAHTEASDRAKKAEGEVKEMRAAVRLGAVKDAATKAIDARIEDAKKDAKTASVEVPVLEMARKRLALTPAVLAETDDKDNTLSVKSALAAFDAQVGEVREMAKSFGAPVAATVKETAAKGTVTTGNKGGEDDMSRYLPSTAKRLAREAAKNEPAKK